jgi:hypothetical protein
MKIQYSKDSEQALFRMFTIIGEVKTWGSLRNKKQITLTVQEGRVSEAIKEFGKAASQELEKAQGIPIDFNHSELFRAFRDIMLIEKSDMELNPELSGILTKCSDAAYYYATEPEYEATEIDKKFIEFYQVFLNRTRTNE